MESSNKNNNLYKVEQQDQDHPELPPRIVRSCTMSFDSSISQKEDMAAKQVTPKPIKPAASQGVFRRTKSDPLPAATPKKTVPQHKAVVPNWMLTSHALLGRRMAVPLTAVLPTAPHCIPGCVAPPPVAEICIPSPERGPQVHRVSTPLSTGTDQTTKEDPQAAEQDGDDNSSIASKDVGLDPHSDAADFESLYLCSQHELYVSRQHEMQAREENRLLKRQLFELQRVLYRQKSMRTTTTAAKRPAAWAVPVSDSKRQRR